jgi:hypothetical protein
MMVSTTTTTSASTEGGSGSSGGGGGGPAILYLIGWEGVWGTLFTSVALLVLGLVPGSDAGHAENVFEAAAQAMSSTLIGGALLVGLFCSTYCDVVCRYCYF